ncbi:MAG: nuclease-related domain-containing protein, partial [Saprospiraceae bacterium]
MFKVLQSVLVYKYLKPKIKGIRGEYKVSRVLRKLDKTEYKIFHDLYLKSEDRYTQIDHLIISIYGVFVIETKNYKGWIHGNEKSEYWTQTIYKKKTKFRNPVKQN